MLNKQSETYMKMNLSTAVPMISRLKYKIVILFEVLQIVGPTIGLASSYDANENCHVHTFWQVCT